MKPRFKCILYLSGVMGILLILTTACPGDDPVPEPSCTDGIKNGNETDVDCGGDCSPCFDCLTNYCSLLSGGTSDQPVSHINWASITAQGEPHVDEWKFNFYSNGTVFENDLGTSASGYWEFDDPNDPSKITITYHEPPQNWTNSGSYTLLHLSTDTLRLHSGTWEWTLINQ